jgi:phosphoglycerate kinase
MNAKIISECGSLRGKRVLLRLDLNVPIQNGVVQDDYRIRRSLKTLLHLKKEGAKTVIVAHLENETNKSLEVVAKHLNTFVPVTFVRDFSPTRESLPVLNEGEFILLENLRLFPNDVEKKNDLEFGKQLACLADVYVNEAFSVSHRRHASVVGVPEHIPGYLGFLFEEEINNLSKAFNPERPFLFILGGAKFETKMPLVQKFAELADQIFVGGALANDFWKARGYELGTSLFSQKPLDLKKLSQNPKLHLPVDIRVTIHDGPQERKPDQVQPAEHIVDSGPETSIQLEKMSKEAKCILWNGPLGAYEGGFTTATEDLALAIAGSGAHSIIGGGDTLAAVARLGIFDKFTFVSTGGGAMLDFLADETLVGIEALKK